MLQQLRACIVDYQPLEEADDINFTVLMPVLLLLEANFGPRWVPWLFFKGLCYVKFCQLLFLTIETFKCVLKHAVLEICPL